MSVTEAKGDLRMDPHLPLAIVAFGCLFIGMSIWFARPLALALTALTPIGLSSLLIHVSAWVPLSLEVKSALFFAALAVAGVVLWVVGQRHKVAVENLSRPLSMLLAVVVLAGLSLLITVNLLPGGFSWAMHEDAVWNTVSARFMVADGGFNAAIHPHSSPLTAALMASQMAFGRGAVPSADLLLHDSMAFGNLWLLFVIIASVLACVAVARFVPNRHPRWQLFLAAAAALLPWSWYVAGWSFDLGYLNASLSVVILLGAWIAWREGREQPVVVSFALALSTTALLATWAPLALMPLALLAVHSLDIVRSRNRTHLIAAICAWGVVVTYVVLVTLRDFARESTALSFDGGMFNYPSWLFALTLVAVVVTALVLGAKRSTDRPLMFGVLSVSVASAVAVAYLLFQRRGAETLWGYYPAKMGWISSILLVVLFLGVGTRLAARIGRTDRRRVAFVAVALATAGILCCVQPPSRFDVFSPLNLVTASGIARHNALVPVVSELASPGTKNVVYNWSTPDGDTFTDLWLLQLPSVTGAEPLRTYAYYVATSQLESVCEVDRVWGASVKVHTTEERLESLLNETCPDNGLTVVVGGP